ncbi:MAG: hypothetical protein ACK5QH_17075 [Rubrivivax sp.]
MKSTTPTPRPLPPRRRAGWLASALLLGRGPVLAQAPAAAVEGCRAWAADATRLACYDALLPPRSANPAAAAAVTPPVATTGTTGAANTPPASATAIPAAPAAPATMAAAPAAGNATATAQLERQFGLEDRRAQEERAQRIQSRIVGRFEGWGPKEKLTLANGQVWQIQDDSVAAYNLNAPAVQIERGAFGSFFMRIEGVAQVPKVRRVQ